MPLILELEDEEPPMVAGQVLTLAVQSPTLKREERKRLQHGPHFSKWKVLVPPCDWENYSAGKDGAERYRVQNLPGNEGPGVYELGVAVPPSGSGRGIKADQIVPVYVGQADSARTRLQQYGRTGAHLGRSCSGNPSEQICKGPGLIEEMLERGYSIVYRWAPMGSKSEAERTERQLLDTHDYAWNTRINGARRRDDVLQKLKEIPSKPIRVTNIVPRPLPSRQKHVGIRINSSNLVSTEDKFSNYADRESRNLIPQVFKFGRSQPRLVLDGSGITWEDTIICGVAVGDGSICRKAPVQGRKRCAEHKGTRITGSITASNADSKSSFISNKDLISYRSGITQENTEICGVAAGDGSTCRRPPVTGRVRCAEHKGMRITESITASNADSKSSFISNRDLISYRSGITQENTEICGVAAGDGSTCRRPPVTGRVRCAEHKGMRITGSITASNVDSECSFTRNRESVSYKSGITQENTEICGVVTGNGSTCRRPPVTGRVRCAEHKGMRITESITASNADSKSSFIGTRELISYKSGITQENTEICGVVTGSGSTCRRPPVPGRVRCAEHKGMRITGSTTASNVDTRCSFIRNREFVSYESGITWENTGICGARTNTGSACRRPPVQGRQRCAVHKGRRI